MRDRSQIAHGRMTRDQSHRFAQQSDSWRYAVPGRRTGWMGQWDQIEYATVATQFESAPDDFVEFGEGDKLRDGQFADGNDEARSQKVDFVVEPT